MQKGILLIIRIWLYMAKCTKQICMKKLMLGLIALVMSLSSFKGMAQEAEIDFQKAKHETTFGFMTLNGFTSVFRENSAAIFDRNEHFKFFQEVSKNMNYSIVDDGENSGEIKIVNTNDENEFIMLKKISSDASTTKYKVSYSANKKDLINIEEPMILSLNQSNVTVSEWVWWVVSGAVAIVKYCTDDSNLTDACTTAINACTKAGGLPSVKIDKGWFSSSCSVTCTK